MPRRSSARGALGALARPPPGDSLALGLRGARPRRRGTPARCATRRWRSRRSAPPTSDSRARWRRRSGEYRVVAQLRRAGHWTEVASTCYRVAEYRPPEFLVDVTGRQRRAGIAGDSVPRSVEARYLFGAPMGRAGVRWTLRQQSASPGGARYPRHRRLLPAETGWWYEELGERVRHRSRSRPSGIDTLDAGGRLSAPRSRWARPSRAASRATLEATVTDVNRQTVSASTSLHRASGRLLSRRQARRAELLLDGRHARSRVQVIAVRPDGDRVHGRAGRPAPSCGASGTQVRRERDGYGELVGEWVSDTVGRGAR